MVPSDAADAADTNACPRKAAANAARAMPLGLQPHADNSDHAW
jgi:hypothetical protein